MMRAIIDFIIGMVILFFFRILMYSYGFYWNFMWCVVCYMGATRNSIT